MFAAATGWPCSTCSTTRLSEQPGTTAGDHLLPAVVLLAVLGGSLALYPRLRAGSREALAVGLGILVTTAGAMHVVHAVIDEAERSDFTGMLAALGGVAMIALGLVVAWRAPAAASGSGAGASAVRCGRALVVGFYVLLPIGAAIFVTRDPSDSPGPGSRMLMRPSSTLKSRPDVADERKLGAHSQVPTGPASR